MRKYKNWGIQQGLQMRYPKDAPRRKKWMYVISGIGRYNVKYRRKSWSNKREITYVKAFFILFRFKTLIHGTSRKMGMSGE